MPTPRKDGLSPRTGRTSLSSLGIGRDDLPADLRRERPGWVLVETAPDSVLTHRPLAALYEDLEKESTHGPIACGWIWESNVRPFCESLAADLGYDFDDSDWQAIELGLADSDNDRPPETWYTYPLVGRSRVDLRMARAEGGSEISIRVEGAPADSRSRINALLGLMSQYFIASQ